MKRSRVLAVLMTAMFSVGLLLAAAAPAQAIRLSLNHESANAGDKVQFSISGTQANARWSVSVDGRDVASGTDPAGDGVSGDFQMPNLGNSSKTVTVSAFSSGEISSHDIRYVVPGSGATGGGGGTSGGSGQSPGTGESPGTVAPIHNGGNRKKTKRTRSPVPKKQVLTPVATTPTPAATNGAKHNAHKARNAGKKSKKRTGGRAHLNRIGPVGHNRVLVGVPEQGRNSLRSLEPRPVGPTANPPKAASAKKPGSGFPLGIAILALSVLGVLFLGAMVLSRAWSFEDYDKSMQTMGIDKAEAAVIAEIKERTAELEAARAAELAERSEQEAAAQEAPTVPEPVAGSAGAPLVPYDPQPLGEDSGEPVKREHAEVVHGLAQDVLVRAQEHGVNGWVQKRADGTLEAVFEGDPDAVERLVQFCQNGPRGTDVEKVETFDEKPEGLSGFSVR